MWGLILAFFSFFFFFFFFLPLCDGHIYHQYCDTSENNCKVLYSEADCEAEPDCDPSNPVCDSSVCKNTNYIWCDAVLGCQSTDNSTICAETDGCDPENPGSCDPTKCLAETYYTCNADTLQCVLGTGPAPNPSFNTSDACEAACVDSDLSGVWRALRVDDGFVADEVAPLFVFFFFFSFFFCFPPHMIGSIAQLPMMITYILFIRVVFFNYFLFFTFFFSLFIMMTQICVCVFFFFSKWDFDFGVTSVTYKSQSSGETYSGTYAVGETISSSSYDAAELTITLSTGTVLQGIISNDRGDQSSTVIFVHEALTYTNT
jgi:hypothetical protein